jgi:hypothetical protein
MTAPKFCGSITPSRATISVVGLDGELLEGDQAQLRGDDDHALVAAAGGEAVEVAARALLDGHAATFGEAGEGFERRADAVLDEDLADGFAVDANGLAGGLDAQDESRHGYAARAARARSISAEDGLRGGRRIGSVADGAAHHQEIGPVGDGLLGGGDALLIARVAPGGADTRRDQEALRPERCAEDAGFGGRGDEAPHAGVPGDAATRITYSVGGPAMCCA